MSFKIELQYWDEEECKKAMLLKRLIIKDYLISEDDILIKRVANSQLNEGEQNG